MWLLIHKNMDTFNKGIRFQTSFPAILLAILALLSTSSFGIKADEHHIVDDHSAINIRLDKIEEDAWTMVQKKGNQFVVNGQPLYVNGFYTYWLMVFAADESTRGKVSEVFQQASSAGLTVCRTWAFNDGQWQALQKSPSVYDEEVFKVILASV